jgi:hypothetical protein
VGLSAFGIGGRGLLTVFVSFLATGCSGEAPEQSLNRVLKEQGQSKATVYPLAGKVTIDGQRPQVDRKTKLVVMLYDPSQPDLPIGRRPVETTDSEGRFAFHTYEQKDGVPAGKYVIVFSLLSYTKKRGYLGPDQLKNQYNDPEVNEKKPDFNINHQPPGKRDYEFDLKVPDGPAGTPGPKALTEIRAR